MEIELVFFAPYTNERIIEMITSIAEKITGLKMRESKNEEGEVKVIGCSCFQLHFDMEDEFGLTKEWGTTFGLEVNKRIDVEMFAEGISQSLKVVGEIIKEIPGDVAFVDDGGEIYLERRKGIITVNSEVEYLDFGNLGIPYQKKCRNRDYHLYINVEPDEDKVSGILKKVAKITMGDRRLLFTGDDCDFYEMHGDEFQVISNMLLFDGATQRRHKVDLVTGEYQIIYTMDTTLKVFCNQYDSQVKVMMKYLGGILTAFSGKMVMILYRRRWKGEKPCLLLEAENGIVKVNEDIPEEEKLPFECMEIPYEECKLGIS